MAYEGLLTWARSLNREFDPPLPDAEVRGVWRSVCRYKARWRVQGHQQGWLWKHAARGKRGAVRATAAGVPGSMRPQPSGSGPTGGQ